MFDSTLHHLLWCELQYILEGETSLQSYRSHLDDGLLPFVVKAIQVKPAQRLRSEVMDELNVAAREESWSLMLDETERRQYSVGRKRYWPCKAKTSKISVEHTKY